MKRVKSLWVHLYDWMGVLLVVCLLVLFLSSPLQANSSPLSLQAMTDGGNVPLVVVDAGHGGADGGAVSADGAIEAGLNLAVARLVEGGLREAGFAVVMTRTDEQALASSKKADMQARREILREDGVDAIVSIHMNKFHDPSISGPMAFYMQGAEEGAQLATAMIEAVCLSIGQPTRPANPGDYFIVRESAAPAVIIECGFLSNRADAQKLQDPTHQQRLADGIVAGVASYLALAGEK